MVNPDTIWDYCWNCGRSIYERQAGSYCCECERVLNDGKLKTFFRQKEVYLSLLKTGRCSNLEATVT